MLKNYLKIALRNISKFKTHSLINIIGLAIGLTGCLLIMLYVKQELSYDTFHDLKERIYRLSVEITSAESESFHAQSPAPMAPVFARDYPEVEKITRLYYVGSILVGSAEKKFFEERFTFADADFFHIFSFPLLLGDPETVLAQPFSCVVTASTARKYFGADNPIGKILRYDARRDFTVTGVVADVPTNSHFKFDFVASYSSLDDDEIGFGTQQWGAFIGSYTYALLPPALDIKNFEAKVKPFLDKHSNSAASVSRQIRLQPLQNIHLFSHLEDEIEPNNSPTNLLIISLIGLFILLIACINFVNLTTARSTRRAKEVGIRKVLGAARPQLLRQFLGESLLMAFLAMVIAFGAVEILLPSFSTLVGKTIQFVFGDNLEIVLSLVGLTLAVGALSGIYPAVVLARFRPATAVKGGLTDSGSSTSFLLRRALVVTQFVISTVLIIAMLVMHNQLTFLQTAELGFKKDLDVIVSIPDFAVTERIEMLRRDFLQYPDITSVTAGTMAPTRRSEFGISVGAYPKGRDAEERFIVDVNGVDFNFIDYFGLEIIAGRNLAKEFATDFQTAFIANEALVRKMGLSSPEEIIGRKLPTGLNRIVGTFIGVAKDYHYSSLHNEIKPMIMLHWPKIFTEMAVRIRPGQISETLATLENSWNRIVPEYPFQYTFLDDRLARFYQAEERTLTIITTFSFLAILVACLGLLGLSALTAQQRTKEIGVRKVLGASIRNIVLLLSGEFVKLVVISGAIAVPIAYVIMNRFLQNFPYRIGIDWQTGLFSVGIALLVAVLTVSFQAVKAALANPVDTLKYE